MNDRERDHRQSSRVEEEQEQEENEDEDEDEETLFSVIQHIILSQRLRGSN
jgi:hypothetical protein